MANISFTPKHISRALPNHLEKIKTEARERKRNILYLILGYLKENMLEQTAETLTREAQIDNNYQLCENVELDVILQEYQSYYYTKFQKYPKIIRKLEESEIRAASRNSKRGKSAKRTSKTPVPPKEVTESTSDNEEFQFEIISLNSSTTKHTDHPKPGKPRPFLPELEQYTSEDKDLVGQISNQVLTQEMDVKWTDCLGLDNAIEILKESTVYPLYYPEIFKDMTPWNGVLLHGPPGTGKTLLAKALASETHTTFFNVTSSTFISKWRGESEKLIKHLFDMAKLHTPSTIFFDEIDALVSSVKDSQHEASKRFRSELLVQLDGISSCDGQIFVLASTNSPWDLDAAILRRFDKRILIDMPTKEARMQILKHHLRNSSNKISQEEMEDFGKLTEHYSGSDIKNLSKEVIMSIVREKIRSAKQGNRSSAYSRVVTYNDIKQALLKIRPSTTSTMCKKYYQWQNEHGAL